MIWQEAMREVKRMVAENYKYSHMQHYNTKGQVIDYQKLNMVHYSFKSETPLKEIQVTFEFQETFFDMLAFPHPVIVTEKFLRETIDFINYVNSIIKVGRLYVDTEYLDIAFSVRVPYDIFEAFETKGIDLSLNSALCFYHDLGYILYAVVTGEMSADEGKISVNRINGGRNMISHNDFDKYY